MTLQAILKACRQRAAIAALLALLLGHWALLTHVHEQGAPSPDETCWLCIHAQHDGNAIPPSSMAQSAIPSAMPQPRLEVVRPSLAVFRHFNPRAPPLASHA